MIVEDTLSDAIPLIENPPPGPMAAVQEFLKTDLGKTFKQDFSREAMFLTYFPGGWLLKE
jgi:cephalosporin hydroxylase